MWVKTMSFKPSRGRSYGCIISGLEMKKAYMTYTISDTEVECVYWVEEISLNFTRISTETRSGEAFELRL